MIKNKKSSLNLSINAIVILILAITMLGLGLTFMRGLFKQATGKIEAAVSAQELANPPTVDNPVTLYPNTLSLRTVEQGKVLLAFMHTEGGNRDCTLNVKTADGVTTVKPGTTGYGNFMIYNYNPVESIPADKIYTWTITFDPDSTGATEISAGNNYIFTSIMDCEDDAPTSNHRYYKKDILIKVAS